MGMRIRSIKLGNAVHVARSVQQIYFETKRNGEPYHTWARKVRHRLDFPRRKDKFMSKDTVEPLAIFRVNKYVHFTFRFLARQIPPTIYP